MHRATALFISLMVGACGGESPAPTTEETSTPTASVVDEPIALGDGVFVVETVQAPESCFDAPGAGDHVRIEGGGQTLRFGRVALPVDATGKGFAGCESDENRWASTQVALVAVGDGYDVDVQVDRIAYREADDCRGYSLSIRPLAPCEPAGKYEATTQEVDAGACDLAWAVRRR